MTEPSRDLDQRPRFPVPEHRRLVVPGAILVVTVRRAIRQIPWIVLLVAACAAPAAPTQRAVPTVVTPAYDLAHVKAVFAADCADTPPIEKAFCAEVKIAAMTAEDTILNVPTTLGPKDKERAKKICQLISFSHFDENAVDLGYEVIGILDSAGGNLYACTVSPL